MGGVADKARDIIVNPEAKVPGGVKELGETCLLFCRAILLVDNIVRRMEEDGDDYVEDYGRQLREVL